MTKEDSLRASPGTSALLSRSGAGPSLSGRHILLVSVLYPPSQGGVEAAAVELADAFHRMGFRVTVATTSAGAVSRGSTTVRVFPRARFSEGVSSFARELRPDLVLVNGLFVMGGMTFPLDIGIATGIPVIYRAHGFNTAFQVHWDHPPFFGLPSFLRSFVRAFFNDAIFRRLTQNVFLDDAIGVFQNFDILIARLFHRRNLSFIPNSFDSLLRTGGSPFRERHGVSIDKPLFLCIANYCDRKGQVDVVRILRRHPELDAQFVFLGSEENESSAEARRLSAGDSRIRLLVGISRDDAVDALNACDAAFLFARQEQQPLFLSEAMSCGKPWFCTNVGSVSKMKGGVVLRHRNERCFLKAVQELLVPDRRRALGEEGRAFWRANYSPSVVYARWKRLLDDAIAGQAKNGY